MTMKMQNLSGGDCKNFSKQVFEGCKEHTGPSEGCSGPSVYARFRVEGLGTFNPSHMP